MIGNSDRSALRTEGSLVNHVSSRAVLITGNTAAGKSTLAREIELHVYKQRRTVVRFDAENVRLGLTADLGFSMEDRDENLRRMAEVARLTIDHGIITVVCAVAPLERHRKLMLDIMGDNTITVFMDTPEQVRRQRDIKGLYARADLGEVELPGVNAEWDPHVEADLVIDADVEPRVAAKRITAALLEDPDDTAWSWSNVLRSFGNIANY